GKPFARIVIAVVPGLRLMVIDDQNFVRQKEHEIALVFGTAQLFIDAVKLKREIIAEGTIKAEIGILWGAEQIHESAKDREDGGSLAPLFFRKYATRL